MTVTMPSSHAANDQPKRALPAKQDQTSLLSGKGKMPRYEPVTAHLCTSALLCACNTSQPRPDQTWPHARCLCAVQ